MNVLVAKYKYKKDLISALGQKLNYQETSLFGKEYKSNGTFCVVGPGAYDRKWYATVTMKNNLIKKVS